MSNEQMEFYKAINDYEVRGYKVADLNEKDKEFIKGMAWMVSIVEEDSGKYFADDDSVIQRLMSEIEYDTTEWILKVMQSAIADMLFSMLDGYPSEDEDDEVSEEMAEMPKKDEAEGDIAVILRKESAESVPHKGCNGCKYEGKSMFDFPCSVCKCTYADKYEKAK